MAANRNQSHPPFIKVYFTNDALPKEIEDLGHQHGLSASKVGEMAVRLGLPLVKKQLSGLLPATIDDTKKE
jgi:hypothetical protein